MLKKIIYISIILSVMNSCSTSGDSSSEDNNIIRAKNDTTYHNGVTLVHFAQEKWNVNYANPSEDFQLTKAASTNDFYVTATPTKIGVIASSKKAFFQKIPASILSLKSEKPQNAQWLNSSNELLNGAVSGLNYLFIDDTHNGKFETIYLVRLDPIEPLNSSKTYIVGKVSMDNGEELDFLTAKKQLDTLENN